jgi:cholesterol transport system auxiliary component
MRYPGPSSLLALGATGLMLSACVSFGSKPPPQLLTISAEHTLPAGQPIRSEGLPALTVMAPEVSRKLATVRIPVQVDPTTVAYVKDAQWTEAPRAMFQRLLSETIAADGAIFVVSAEQYASLPGRRLTGELVDFGIDAQTREAVVTFDAVLGGTEPGTAVRQRFTARVPVDDIKAKKVAAPINAAANKVAADVTAWVKGS